MKKFFSGVVMLLLVLLMATSTKFNLSSVNNAERAKKHHCFGYTVVEAGRGVNCYGDTVVLVKRDGFYQMASLKH